MYVSVDETGRICATTPYEEFAEGMEEFDFPEDFNYENQDDYRIVDGELILDKFVPPVEQQIADLKDELKRTDSDVLEFYGYQILGKSIPDEDVDRFANALKQRSEIRKKISELEAQGGD